MMTSNEIGRAVHSTVETSMRALAAKSYFARMRLAYSAVCTPSLDASDSLDVLADCLLEQGILPSDTEDPRTAALAWARTVWTFHESSPSLHVEGSWRIRVMDMRITRNTGARMAVRFHVLDGELAGREYVVLARPGSIDFTATAVDREECQLSVRKRRNGRFVRTWTMTGAVPR